MTTLNLAEWKGRCRGLDPTGEVYVETGLGRADSFALAAGFADPPFARVVGVEYDRDLAAAARARFAGDPRVEVHTGDSTHLLPRLVEAARKTVFYLDSHYDEVAEPAESGQCPLLAEVRTIMAAPWLYRPVVFVDDVSIFMSAFTWWKRCGPGFRRADWPRWGDLYDELGGCEHRWRMALEGDLLVLW